VQLLGGLAGLVLPALFVAAIVLKLFISPDLFTVRSHIALMDNDPHQPELPTEGQHLSVRLYSSTRFRLLDVSFTVVLRRSTIEPNGRTLQIHCPIKAKNPRWPVALNGVPYTLIIPLEEDDVSAAESQARTVVAVQGTPIGPEDVLIVLIAGRVPDLSSEFTEAHDFTVQEVVSDRPYGGIEVAYGERPRSWPGWSEFDE
jgi:hypothetical protein